jgi:hypothetical protein
VTPAEQEADPWMGAEQPRAPEQDDDEFPGRDE